MQRTKLAGRLERRDLEGGVWILHTHKGEVTLYGDVPHTLAGHHVEVEGDTDEGFGFAMTGPAVTVRTVRKA
ncbi:MAG: hypothetical protein Q8P18_10455 [Pseudomonadota bacterium]|nr:hypothetical protein [Pseudomonadota bacterium]